MAYDVPEDAALALWVDVRGANPKVVAVEFESPTEAHVYLELEPGFFPEENICELTAAGWVWRGSAGP